LWLVKDAFACPHCQARLASNRQQTLKLSLLVGLAIFVSAIGLEWSLLQTTPGELSFFLAWGTGSWFYFGKLQVTRA
jgi:hypothetical protein